MAYKIILAVATLCLTVACSNDYNSIKEKVLTERDQIVEEFNVYENTYNPTEADYTITHEYSGITSVVRGHKESPVQFWSRDSSGVHTEGVRYYTDDTPIRLTNATENTITFSLGTDSYTLNDVVQRGNNLSFKLIVNGIETGNYNVKSPYFEHQNIMDTVVPNTKFPLLPIIYAAVKYVVVPLAVGVAASAIANSCTNDNQSPQQDCRAKLQELANKCQNDGRTPVVKHENCPKDCFYTCV